MQYELLFEITPGHRKVTNVIEYGTRLSDLMSGKLPGPEGAHFDFHVVADTVGRLTGKTRAIVSMAVNPDGTSSLELHESLSWEV